MADEKQNQPDANAKPEEKKPLDRSYIAATHGAETAPHSHPGHAEVSRESTGRTADDSWKTKDK